MVAAVSKTGLLFLSIAACGILSSIWFQGETIKRLDIFSFLLSPIFTPPAGVPTPNASIHVNSADNMSTDKSLRRKKFEDVFEVIRDELITHFAGEGMPKDAVEWYRRVSVL
jgi:hypothetical protein